MSRELPTMNYCNLASNTVRIGDAMPYWASNASPYINNISNIPGEPQLWPDPDNFGDYSSPSRRRGAGETGSRSELAMATLSTMSAVGATGPIHKTVKETEMAKDQTRVVRVFIADPDARVPVEKRVLSSTEERVTDATDQELFYELEIKPLLDKHNEYRQTVLDKAATAKVGKDVFLEPIKIRDLVMTVVCVASF